MKTIFTILFFIPLVASAEGKNYIAEGSLESPNPAGCVDIGKLKPTQNPADIFAGVEKCVSTGKSDTAARLYFVAMAYGRYDTLRVADSTAHQAIPALQAKTANSLNEAERKEFIAAVELLYGNEAAQEEACLGLVALGNPEYEPTYMLHHGMSAFLESESSLAENFDPLKSWNAVLADFSKCGKALHSNQPRNVKNGRN